MKMMWIAPALALVIGAGVANADTILLQDDFNTENGGSGALNYTGFANFSSTGSGYVDLIGTGYYDLYPGNGLYVDMDGTSGPGQLTSNSSFSLLPGFQYKLQFDLGGSQRGDTNTVNVSLGSAFSEGFTLNSGDPLTTYTRTFSVASPTSASLVFDEPGSADNYGLILDNVLLSQGEVSSVPEPGTWAMLAGLGLSGAGFLRRRRSK